jgi:hypothetical protein
MPLLGCRLRLPFFLVYRLGSVTANFRRLKLFPTIHNVKENLKKPMKNHRVKPEKAYGSAKVSPIGLEESDRENRGRFGA